jgi:hypothetical protein
MFRRMLLRHRHAAHAIHHGAWDERGMRRGRCVWHPANGHERAHHQRDKRKVDRGATQSVQVR